MSDHYPEKINLAIRNRDAATLAELLLTGGSANDYGKQTFTALHLACDEGLLELVRTLIDNSADVNAKDLSTGDTPLHVACGRGETEIVEILIDNGANINLLDNRGKSSLHYAGQVSDNGAFTTAALLLRCGSDINLRDHDGETPLMKAVRSQSTALVIHLLDSGAASNIVSMFGQSAMDVAIDQLKAITVAGEVPVEYITNWRTITDIIRILRCTSNAMIWRDP